MINHKINQKKIEKFSVTELEDLVVQLYKEKQKKLFRYEFDMVLLKRYSKLNHNFSWTAECKAKFLEKNERLMTIFTNSYNEAIATAKKLEQRIQRGDPFLSDYEIEIELQPYIFDKNDYEDDCIALVLSEPDHYPINYCISHSSFKDDIKNVPIYLDNTFNWNNQYLTGIFDDHYICYQIHLLLENHWAFQDILNINQIWSDVKVKYQHHHLMTNLPE